MLTCVQRAVAPIAATLLAGGIALFPKKTAFAEEPRDNVWSDLFLALFECLRRLGLTHDCFPNIAETYLR